MDKRLFVFLLVAFIALSQIFVGWVILHGLDKSSINDASTTTETVASTPYLDPDLSLAQDIVARLQDNDTANDNITDSFSRNNFLKTLVSQMGSSGEIIGGGMSSYDYYTEWYIGGYSTDKTGWSKSTPWCASYISWCIGQINLSVNGQAPRYANVDLFKNYFDTESWMTPDQTPGAGDLVFFGTNNDPNHMGVVLATDEEAIYTIEGNTANVVGIRKYSILDERIIGYGVIDWRQ